MAAIPEIDSFKNKLQLERGKMMDAVATFTADELVAPVPDGWSIRQILAHVASSEPINVKFAQMMLSSDQPVQLDAVAADYPDFVGPFDLDTFNEYRADKLRVHSLDVVLKEMRSTREATYAWMDTLTLEELDRNGAHAVWGAQSVRAMLKILIIHDKAHAQEIVRRKSE